MEPTSHRQNSPQPLQCGAASNVCTADRDPIFRTGFSSKSEERRILAWLNAGLRPNRPEYLQQEYPFLFGPASAAIALTGYVGEEPTSFCVLWPSPFQIGAGSLRMGLISLVYTSPAHRGQGYASKIIKRAIQIASEQHLGCVALWSDLDSFYRRLGFLESGCEMLLKLTPDLLDRAQDETHALHPDSGIVVSAPRPSDWEAIELFRAERPCKRGLHLAPRVMDAIPDMEVRVARRRDKVLGFALHGRGEDFRDVIHEWGGDSHAILLCCKALCDDDPLTPTTHLLGASDQDDLFRRLRRAGASFSSKSLAWFRLADTESFADDLADCLGRQRDLEIFEISSTKHEPNSILLRSPAAEIKIPLQTFLDGCFGSPSDIAQNDAAQALAPLFSDGYADSLPLPLPFFVSGLESI